MKKTMQTIDSPVDTLSTQPRQRNAVVMVFTLVLMVVLLGFAAMTIDVGVIYNTRADLQNAADAAALAGAAAYGCEAMVQVRLGKNKSSNMATVIQLATRRAKYAASRNTSFASGSVILETNDVALGWIDATSSISPLESTVDAKEYNAVHVLATRSKDSENGAVQLYFAPIFGKHFTSVSASAVAMYDDRFAAYDIAVPGIANVWPFTISTSDYDAWIAGSTDSFGYDHDSHQVFAKPDGTIEIRLYPDKLAPSNYGLLNIGTPNQSTTALIEQIKSGVSEGDIELEIGHSKLTFYDEDGDPTGYTITGNPGLKSSIESAIKTRIGDIVAFFVHDQVSKSGSNTKYHVVGLRFARVMNVMLQGSSNKRGLFMQPVSYSGPGIITVAGAPSSGGNAARVLLVR